MNNLTADMLAALSSAQPAVAAALTTTPPPPPEPARLPLRRARQPGRKAGHAEPSQAPPVDACARCGAQLITLDVEVRCSSCNLIVPLVSSEDGGPRRISSVRPSGSVAFSSGGAAVQRVHNELKKYHVRAVEAKRLCFSDHIYQRAAEIFYSVQCNYVKRNNCKALLLAAALHLACVETGYSPPKPEVAAFMQLSRKGFAQGEAFLRDMIANDTLQAVDIDPLTSLVNTVFVKLGSCAEQYLHLTPTIVAVVKRVDELVLGTSSTQRSKVAAAAVVVLHAASKGAISRTMVCDKFGVRSTTIEPVLSDIEAFKSEFDELLKPLAPEGALPIISRSRARAAKSKKKPDA